MRCVVCRHGTTRPGKVAVSLDRDRLTLVVKSVPAEVCDNCGEQYVGEDIVANLLCQAEEAARAGVQVEVREYSA